MDWNMYFNDEKCKMKTPECKVCMKLNGDEEEQVWYGWLKQVNEDLSSSSDVFKSNPHFQLMWQNGYGPEDPLNCDLKAWEDYLYGLPYPARYSLDIKLFYPPVDDKINDDKINDDKINDDYDHDNYLWARYQDQLYESEGFDVDVCLTHGGGILPYFNDKHPIPGQAYRKLSDYSRNAVGYYNQEEDTDYTVNRVVKSCMQFVDGMLYFITFEVKNSKDCFQVFQAKIQVQGIEDSGKVLLVRPKSIGWMRSDTHSNKIKDLSTLPIIDSHQAAKLWDKYLKQINESEGFDIDVYPTDGYGRIQPMFNETTPVSAKIYYMLSKMSSIAVAAYNQREGSHYTVNRVVKVCTQVDCGIMYFITFEAIQSEDHFHQVFQAIVYAPIIGENKVLLVRAKAMANSHRDLGKYVEQIKETQGFDIDVRISDGHGTIVPMCSLLSCAKTYDSLFAYSRNALDDYNSREGDDYILIQVVNACMQLVAGVMYYITFEAQNSKGHFQVFQAKVYVTGIEEDKVLLVRPKALGGLPSDTLSNMMKDLSTSRIIHSHQVAKRWEKYLKQIRESEGFDIDVCPTDGFGIIKPTLSDTRLVITEIASVFRSCASLALTDYNHREGTDYAVNRVVKVCTQVDCGIMDFITFEAIQSEDHVHQVFQAIVYAPIIGEDIGEYTVLLVRPKATLKDLFISCRDCHHDVKCLGKYVEQIKETQGFDIDVRISDGHGTIVPMCSLMSCAKTYDSLFSYSRNALDDYNSREGDDYFVIRVVNACMQVVAMLMYYITFEAQNSRGHFQVFQAKVYVHGIEEENEVLLVRPKA